jgi:hypothetical protein
VIESSPKRLTSHKDLDGAVPSRPNPNDATPPVWPFRPIRASANPALKDGASSERVALVRSECVRCAKPKLPRMNYTYIARGEWYPMVVLAKVNYCKSDIAPVMNHHKLTLGRERRHNRGQHGHRPKQAYEFSQACLRTGESSPRLIPTSLLVIQCIVLCASEGMQR